MPRPCRSSPPAAGMRGCFPVPAVGGFQSVQLSDVQPGERCSAPGKANLSQKQLTRKFCWLLYRFEEFLTNT